MSSYQFKNAPTPSSPSTAWATLSGTITSGATAITVSSAANFPSGNQFVILIGDEFLLVTAGAGTTSWTVTRGVEGSTAAAHTAGDSIFGIVTAAAFLANPRSMTTTGDLEYLDSSGQPARLAAPANGNYVVNWATSVPTWAAAVTASSATAFTNKTGNISQWTNDSGYALATGPTLVAPVTVTDVVGSSAITINGATQTSSFPVINASQTWNNGGVTFTGIKLNVTNTVSAASSLLIDLQVGAASQFSVTRAGMITVPSTGGVVVESRANISFPVNGRFLFSNSSGTDFVRLQLGGTTSSFPAIKRSGVGLHIRLSDDSDYSDVGLRDLAVNGSLTIADAKNIILNTTTGTKIGTATTQKLAFYDATPIVQGASVADATDAGSAITQLNALISRIEATGLIATV